MKYGDPHYYGVNVCVPPHSPTHQIHMLKPNAQYDGIGRWGLCEMLMRVEPSCIGLVLL